MRVSIICFALGIWLCQQQASLPDWPFLAALAGGALLLLGLAMRFRQPAARIGYPLAALLAGFIWAAMLAQVRLADHLPAEHEGRDIQITGVISSLPQAFEHGTRFEFSVEQASLAIPRRIALSWYRTRQAGEAESNDNARLQEVHAGERWQLTVRLKRPHGNLNPHGFDYEAWLFEHGVRATGYVRAALPDAPNRRLDEFVPRPMLAVERLRENIRARFQVSLAEHEYGGVLIALAVGDQRAIDSRLWELFSRTGITHLMSISGLHVTMFAGLGYWLIAALWRRAPPLALRLPAQKAAVIGGFVAALAYCLLAGFGVPAQRTLFMLGVVAVALWAGRMTSAGRVLALALLLVLLMDPWAVTAAGFWLSFGAVALLFYINAGRLAARHWLLEWGRAQWAITLGMIPALLALFQQFSLVSPFANALAIPVISLIVTPLTLLAAVLPFEFPLSLAHQITVWLMLLMEWLGSLPLAMWQQHAPPGWALAVALTGCVVLLLPRGFPARWSGAFLLLPLLLVTPSRPAIGELRLTVLDVGQGLAVHVQTHEHDLIYDTGPQFSADADSGNRIIVPYLRALGVRQLDGLIITHQDKDHSGGMESVLAALPVGWVASSLPPDHPLRLLSNEHRPCYTGQSWEWEGVRFDMLHPPLESYAQPIRKTRKTNDMSCVLKITAGSSSVLLTADIEALTERALLETPAALKSTYLVVPHHGSRTSSTSEFIAAVDAATAIFPVGYRSRFRHPHPEVLARYEASGARLLRTDLDGAVTLRLPSETQIVELERARQRRYWHNG